jgi:PAS domain S-box-containing protein
MATRFLDPTLFRTPDQAVEFIGSILDSSTKHSIIGEDLDGNILLWNEGARLLYGYRPEDVVGKENSRILQTAADIAAGLPERMHDVALRTGHWEGVVRRTRKNGSTFKARVVLTTRRDEEGKPVGFLLMSKDVSGGEANEDERAPQPFDSSIVGTIDLERALSQLTLQRVALDTAAAIVITDAAHLILWVNPAFTTTTGYTAEEVVGKSPRVLRSNADDDALYAEFCKTINSGRTWRGQFVNRKKDGTVYYDDQIVTPVRDDNGQITNFVTIMHDVSARKMAADQLLVAHGQMRDLLEHSPSVLYALRLEGDSFVPCFASPNIARLLGCEINESLSREWWFSRVHPDDRAMAEASIADTIATGASRSEYRLKYRDGTYRWVDDHRRLVCNADGHAVELVGAWTDISAQKQAQDQLAQSERRLWDVLDNLNLIAVMLDRDGRISYCNDFFLQLTGFARGDVIGQDWLEQFVPPEDRAGLRETYALLLANDPEAWHYRNAILTTSGARRMIQWNNSLLRSAAGVVIGVAAIGEDVTDRVLAESEIVSSEERLRIIIDASTDAVWQWNVESGEGHWSDRAYSMLGYERDTFQPTLESFLPLVHPDDAAALKAEVTEHLDYNKPFHFRLRVRHSNGSFLPILVRGQLRREMAQMVGVFTDLSVVEGAVEQIREQAALIDQTRDAIVVRDLDDAIVFWSKGAERLYEHAAHDVVGSFFARILHIDRRRFDDAMEKTLVDGAWSGEMERLTASGRQVVVYCSWTLVTDDLGRPKSIISIDTDITERKNIEQQFFRAQRLESLGTLAGGIAHDLNNVFMPILMGATLLKRLQPGEKSLRAINNIENSVRRGADLVKQVLLFARGVEGSRSSISISDTVSEVQAILESTFPKNIAFVTSLPDTLATVVADATQLSQVFLNLCVNARDAMPDGGQLTVTACENDVDLAYAQLHGGAAAGRYVVLEVADTGTGMTKEVADRVFEPFFTTKEFGSGTGLGLSTARGIVHGHGGFIVLTSTLGKGSTFAVYLPASTGRAAPPIADTDTECTSRGDGATILVVDDETAILDMTRETLSSFGYNVKTADSGAQAIAMYAREHSSIAVVVTDLMMPVMDGYAVISAIRRIDPAVPIIAMSGHGEPSHVAAAMAARATTFLAKPCSTELMLRTLSRILKTARSSGPVTAIAS